MTTPEQEHNGEHDIKSEVRQWASERLGWINELATELGGEGVKIEDVLLSPPAVRDEAPMPAWTEEQEERAREVGRRLGYGAEQDVSSGLTGVVSIIEGGKIWKIMAEAEAVKQENSPRVIYSGSANRKLGQDELDYLKEKQGAYLPAGTTEYDAARWVAERQLEGPSQPKTLEFGYETTEGNPIVSEATGQLVRLGTTADGRTVELFRVDREDFEAEDGSKKYRNQPDNMRVMEIISETLKHSGDETTPITLATSNTYASRQVNAVRAGIHQGRQFGVTMYGRQTLKDLDAPVPAATPLNHLPGDLRIMHDSLQGLLAEVEE